MSMSILEIRLRLHADADGDLSYLEQTYDDVPAADREKYVRQDRERIAAYERGDWSFVGTDAAAIVEIDGIRQTLTSGGLWGTESDSDLDHFCEIASEELDALRSILRSVGFTDAAIDEATPTDPNPRFYV